MPVIIGQTSIRPAPQVIFSQTHTATGDSRRLGTTTQATLKGTLVADMTDDTFTPLTIDLKLAAIIAKQEEFRQLFIPDGQWFEVQGYDGSAPVKFAAIVESIEFDAGPWTDKCDYTVVLKGEPFADEESDADLHVESASENWQFEEAEGPHTYRASHTVNAKGKTLYQSEGTLPKKAWEYAKDFAINNLGLGWTSLPNPFWSASGSTLFGESSVQPDALLPFNRVITENIDELEGSYSATETFFVSQDPWWEEYTVAVRKEVNDPWTGNVVTISGTIHGLTTNLHDPEGKFANAKARWATVEGLLYSRVSGYAAPVVVNARRTAQQVDFNPNEGTVTYSYEFNDRPIVNDTLEFYNILLQTSIEDNKTTVTIDGSIVGIRYPDDPYNPFEPFLKYNRAWAQWQNVKGLLFARVQNEAGVNDLKAFPVSASVTPNKQDGSVNYSFSFDNRIPETVRHEFTVSTRFSREDGRTIIAVDGTITGFRTASPTYPFQPNIQYERYENALAYFDGVQPNILGLAATYVDVGIINPVPYSKGVTHNPAGGQLTYQYEYNSIPNPCVPGALSENITISEDEAIPVIPELGVPGRGQGPILQDTGTVTVRRRTVVIEIVMPVVANMNMCAISPAPTIDVSGFAPVATVVYQEQGQTQWTPTNGHFTRTVAWKYEL